MNQLGRGNFFKPYTKDTAFMIWDSLVGFATFGRIVNNVQIGGFDASNSAAILSGLIDGVLGVLLTGLFFWVFMSPYLIYRKRKVSKKISESGS